MILLKLLFRNKEESYHQLVMNEDEITIGGGGEGRSEKCLTTNDREKWSFVVEFLVVIFGISAWIGVNGIYVQLPLLVTSAPEKWNLAAYLVVIIQAANLGPAIYTVTRKFYHLNESWCIFLLLTIGSLAMGLLAFFYNTTFNLTGTKEHSLILFVCSFIMGLIGCTSSVLFMPYLRNSSERYLVFYFIGEGLSGLLPSLVALLQGVGSSNNSECIHYPNGTIVEISPGLPRFSSRNYFIFIFSVLVLSLCSFTMLQYVLSIEPKNSRTSTNSTIRRIMMSNDRESEINDSRLSISIINENTYGIIGNNNNNTKMKRDTISRTVYLHILVVLVCFFGNGFLPGLQTYSCLPYGNIAFHLTVTLANIANPTACLIYLWLLNSVNQKIIVDAVTVIGVVTCAYATYLAAMSPNPPLRNSIIGIIFAVTAWIILTGVISYLKLFITSTVRQKLGPDGLVPIGMLMQLGSACGALLSFGLINYTSLFHQTKPCVAAAPSL